LGVDSIALFAPQIEGTAMTPFLQRKSFVAVLVDLTSSAIATDQIDEAARVLTGLRVLRPALLELDILEGWILIKRSRYAEAVQLLRGMEASATQWSMGKAMMALCQKHMGDSDWLANANEVLHGDATQDAKDMVMHIFKEQTAPADTEEKEAPALEILPSALSSYMYMRA
jgi:type III secretion protein HrpB1